MRTLWTVNGHVGNSQFREFFWSEYEIKWFYLGILYTKSEGKHFFHTIVKYISFLLYKMLPFIVYNTVNKTPLYLKLNVLRYFVLKTKLN